MGKRPCPDCGGELEWDAARQVLRCPYCGFVPGDQPAPRPPAGLGTAAAAAALSPVEELDLETALASPDAAHRGYGGETVKVKCQSCHAISVFDPSRVAQRCDFCGSPAIVPYAATRDAITPQSVLPMRLGEPQARDVVKAWYRSRWLAPNRLKSAGLTDTLRGVYLPYWTFDAHVTARWTAESGDYYYDTELVTAADGKRVARQVRKVRWYPTAGQLAHFFDDELVPGSAGVRLDLLRAVEPFPTQNLVPYDPAFVRGWTVERYQVDLRSASVASSRQMEQKAYAMCAARVPGDTHRNLRVTTDYASRTFKHVLVPAWLVTYTFGPRTFQTIVNGQTGAVAGDAPVSGVKVLFYIVLPAMIALAVLVWLQSR